ncbi:hypothetical protein [Cloacibacillus evryensis]|uniref:hypothetical protein n=1 Tax=Cloacibacillus evryensis TaxID=508460 RepID=UPI000240DD3F|nr:hypothetical protein [Cloacibacillus evryensis]EHL66933.1 hypothetical protein HMPREF1006_01426 [Synergistes sp. 3_1_syn1]
MMIDTDFFPKLEPLNLISFDRAKKRLLIISEGFEERSLSFISQKFNFSFDKIIICRYEPQKESKYNELIKVIESRCLTKDMNSIIFNRFEPFLFEVEINKYLESCSYKYDEVIVDISVMSKYMIMQIMYMLKGYSGNVCLIYTEPVQYAPLEDTKVFDEQNKATLLPSVGVQNIVRTPLLISLVMQQSPSLLVAFLSFNERLVRALLSECNPARVLLINGVAPHVPWRERAMNDIHRNIIKEYYHDNLTNSEGVLERKSSTLYYGETFKLLVEIYKLYCEDYRIILSPTGSKMQAFACALIKICCDDIHIEYPTPESYYVDGYSSSEIRLIHQAYFANFKGYVSELAAQYGLNG